MRRLLCTCSMFALVTFVAPTPGYAQQSLNFFVGGFVPRGEDARVDGDVLLNDLGFFTFDPSDPGGLEKFKGWTIGAEWLIAVHDNVEVGLGLGVYSKSVDSMYSDLVNENGANIEQRLKLRIVPFTASFRVLPFGRRAPIQPYLGAGVSIMSWRYTETGDFVDFNGNIFPDRFIGSGTETGPLLLGGVRIPIGSVDLGGEIRHQSGTGKVDPLDFAGATKVDLGGFSYLATVNIRF